MLLRGEISPLAGRRSVRVRRRRRFGTCAYLHDRRVVGPASPVRTSRTRHARGRLRAPDDGRCDEHTSPGKSSFRRVVSGRGCRREKPKEDGGFGATAAGPRALPFRARRTTRLPLLLLTMTTTSSIGFARRVIRLRARPLVLSLAVLCATEQSSTSRTIVSGSNASRLCLRALGAARARSVASDSARVPRRAAASRARAVVFAFRGQRLERLLFEAKAKGHLRRRAGTETPLRRISCRPDRAEGGRAA